MKIYTLILLSLLNFSTIQAQVKSGEIVYNLKLSFKPNETSKKNNSSGNATLASMLKEAENDLAEVRGILKFNSGKSYFTKKLPMQIKNRSSLNISLSLLGLNNEGYLLSTAKQEKLRVTEKFGKTYLVEEDLIPKENWNVTQEMKKLGDYVVYKATTTKVVENSKGKFEHRVTAWFAPEIPYSFGPLGYGGLPGLILQLEVNSNFPSKYTVESIEFSKEELKIEIPNGQRISAEEIDKMARKAMSNLKDL